MYDNKQKLEMYTVPDELFIVKSRLQDIYIHGKDYSKEEILKQLANLNWIMEEI